jgi:hypothetical protein
MLAISAAGASDQGRVRQENQNRWLADPAAGSMGGAPTGALAANWVIERQQSMGMAGEALPEAQVLTLCSEDRLVLCSDRVTGFLTEEDLHTCLLTTQAPNVLCQRLIEKADAAGGADNSTATVVACGRTQQ